MFKPLIKKILLLFIKPEMRTWVRLYLSYKNAERYVPKRINFLSYKIIVLDPLSFIYQFKEIFLEGIYRFHIEGEYPIIIDCGANIGTSILYFKKLYPKSKIIAFEADPKVSGSLKRNLQDNNVNDVTLHNKAVWIHDEGLEFSADGADGGSLFGLKNVIRVESIRLSTFLKDFNYIDFLKIDIEGAEYEVIEDCFDSLGNVKHLFIEYHSFINHPQKLDRILYILSTNGFRYYIQSIAHKTNPFIKVTSLEPMDLQLNIFALNERRT